MATHFDPVQRIYRPVRFRLEKANPKALIEAEKENLRKQIARFNDNLATHAGFVERLMRQIKNLEQKEKELTARVAANIKAGNRAVAGQMALELQIGQGPARGEPPAARRRRGDLQETGQVPRRLRPGGPGQDREAQPADDGDRDDGGPGRAAGDGHGA